MTYQLFCDGACRGNPGPMGVGGVIKKDQQICLTYQAFLDKGTNNIAEYQALILGLKKAKDLSISTLAVYMDSLLVIKQITNAWKVKQPHLKPLHQEVQNLAKGFKSISFHHIPREKNALADKLANEALSKQPLEKVSAAR